MYYAADEADDTLSLSDLPLYGDGDSEQNLSAQSQGSISISSSDDEYFEFFSQELTPSAVEFPPENFIFCGKTLPHTIPNSPEEIPTNLIESTKRRIGGESGRKLGPKRQGTTLIDDPHLGEKRYNSGKHGKGAILASTQSGKGRWYLYLSGVSRFSGEMELRDMRSRQSRRHSAPSSPVKEKISGERNGGLSGLIRVLSCGGDHRPTTMAVEPISRKRLARGTVGR